MSTSIEILIWITDELPVPLKDIESDPNRYLPPLINIVWRENHWDGIIRLEHASFSYDILDDVEGAISDICLIAPKLLSQGASYTSHYFSSSYSLTFTPLESGSVLLSPKSEPSFALPLQELLPALLHSGERFIDLLRRLDLKEPALKLHYRITELQSLADEARATLVANGYLDG